MKNFFFSAVGVSFCTKQVKTELIPKRSVGNDVPRVCGRTCACADALLRDDNVVDQKYLCSVRVFELHIETVSNGDSDSICICVEVIYHN